MNIFYMIGVVVVIVLVASFLGLHVWTNKSIRLWLDPLTKENCCSVMQKEFCDTIRGKADIATARAQVRKWCQNGMVWLFSRHQIASPAAHSGCTV